MARPARRPTVIVVLLGCFTLAVVAIVARFAARRTPAVVQEQLLGQQAPGGGSTPSSSTPPLGSVPQQCGVPGYTVLGRSDPDPATWPGGGFVVLNMQHSIPPVDHKYLTQNRTCFEIAQQVDQPYSELYHRRQGPPQDLPGGLPRTFFRWEGNISREEFDQVPNPLPRGPQCTHCGAAVRYQIVDNHLYRLGEPPNWLVKVGEDLLLAALHLWQLPDMDFIVHFDDSCPPDVPVLTWNVCRHKAKAGFTFPSYTAWMYALGPEQLKVYQQCLISRYPLSARRPVVFWRGSTTDPNVDDLRIEHMDKVARVLIHKRYAQDSVVDAKLSKLIQKTADNDCVRRYLHPLAPMVALEDYNQAAVIMDVDGNGWSDRMSRVVHFPSVTLKQASNHTAFFEHLLAPGHAAEYFANDLSDLKARGNSLIAEWNISTSRLVQLATQKQGLGMAFLNQVAVAEAAAYSLLQYSKRITWKFEHNTSYTHVPFSKACGGQGSQGARLPKQLCDEMRARPSHGLAAVLAPGAHLQGQVPGGGSAHLAARKGRRHLVMAAPAA